jgi:hypothetical protein
VPCSLACENTLRNNGFGNHLSRSRWRSNGRHPRCPLSASCVVYLTTSCACRLTSVPCAVFYCRHLVILPPTPSQFFSHRCRTSDRRPCSPVQCRRVLPPLLPLLFSPGASLTPYAAARFSIRRCSRRSRPVERPDPIPAATTLLADATLHR